MQMRYLQSLPLISSLFALFCTIFALSKFAYISRASASSSSELKITFSSPEPLGLICNGFPTTWPRSDGLWGRECKDHWKSISWIQCFDIELRYIVKRYWEVLCFVRHARLMVCLLVRASSFSIMLNQRLRRPYFYYCSLNSGAPTRI